MVGDGADRQTARRKLWLAAALILTSVAAMIAFYGIAFESKTLPLRLGSLSFPEAHHAYLIWLWSTLGMVAVASGAASIALVWNRIAAPLPDGKQGIATGPRWIGLGMLAALLLPLAIRHLLLHGAPLTDDEAAYGFSARLLMAGRLWIESPPDKLFFDRLFFVNDGRYYTHYFLGWPALMIPGLLAGVGSAINALYHALTLPALFLLGRDLAGERVARWSVLLSLLAPFATIMAATGLAHSSCLCAAAWSVYALLRSTREGESALWSAAGSATFCIAFFVRPLSALGIVGAILIVWALRNLRPGPSSRRLRHGLAFLVPASVFATLFLYVNAAQTGSAFSSAYQKLIEYTAANDYRFSAWSAELAHPLFHADLVSGTTRSATAILRLNADLFGWPTSLLLLLFALGDRRAGLLWATAASFVVTHWFVVDSGIDSFGPLHFYELLLPCVLLSAVGLDRVGCRLREFSHTSISRSWFAHLPVAFVISATLLSWAGYTGIRLFTLKQIASEVSYPLRVVEAPRFDNSLIFLHGSFASSCTERPVNHFVYAPPANSVGLDGRTVWVNHLSIEHDQRFAAIRYPQRTAWLVWWEECRLRSELLESFGPFDFPASPYASEGSRR